MLFTPELIEKCQRKGLHLRSGHPLYHIATKEHNQELRRCLELWFSRLSLDDQFVFRKKLVSDPVGVVGTIAELRGLEPFLLNDTIKLQYSPVVDGLTPDWIMHTEHGSYIIEVFAYNSDQLVAKQWGNVRVLDEALSSLPIPASELAPFR